MNAKYQRVASLIEQRIRDGDLADGQRLPGESELARDLQVSRGTVRQAIGELHRRRLVSTQMGVGSFVTFDGVALDTPRGWAHALAVGGTPLDVEILAIAHAAPPTLAALAAPADLADAILVRRLRRLPDGSPVSVENAVVPARGPLRELPTQGLVDASLTATLAAAGLRAAHGEQQVGVELLDAADAAVLRRGEGTPFLRSMRTSYTRAGDVVEHVVSFLDPAHFRLHITFGESA